jgi:hypothetical protein
VLYDLASDYQNFQTSEDRIVKSYSFIYSGILALLSISLALFIYKKRSNRKFKKEIQYDHPLIHKILSTGKQQLSQEEIDGIFGISDIRLAESQRFKRSSIINDINLETKAKTGVALIQRKQDSNDKRKFIYHIGH